MLRTLLSAWFIALKGGLVGYFCGVTVAALLPHTWRWDPNLSPVREEKTGGKPRGSVNSTLENSRVRVEELSP